MAVHSAKSAAATLKYFRDHRSRNSEEVIDLWENYVYNRKSDLGDNMWDILEQVCFAALDCNRQSLAEYCLDQLKNRFPLSSRVDKLQALCYEAVGEYDDAIKIYDRLIKADPTNTIFCRKRKVAIWIGKHDILSAIKELNEYLEIYVNDTESWIQLSELFLAENDIMKATYCLESCVLISPNNHMYFRRLAELRYTIGGISNIELAKKYFEHAIKLCGNDLRSEYGLALCASNLKRSTSSDKR